MNLKDFINDAFAVRLGVFLGKVLTRQAGYKLASWAGKWIAAHPSYKMVKAVKANQWIVMDGKIDHSGLNEQTKQVFQSAGRSLFDFFHYISQPDKLFNIVKMSPKAEAALTRIRANLPTIILVPHLSNFDLMGYALALMGIKVQVLSFPMPNSAYKMQNKLREQAGVVVTPMSLTAFREAKVRLNNGGTVVTGLDRPIPGEKEEKYRPRFFGREANLPVIHIRLAKETKSAIYVMGCVAHDDLTYYLECSDPIFVEAKEDLTDETIENAERVLHEAEKLIRQVPQQWAMFYPVWPEVNDEISHLMGKES